MRPSAVRSNTAPQYSELAHAIGGLLRVELGHARMVQVLAAHHRVAEMGLPRVGGGDVGESRRDAAFGHHRVRLAEERLADEPDVGPVRLGRDRGPQPGTAGADHEHVVRACLGCRFGHRSGLRLPRSGSPDR